MKNVERRNFLKTAAVAAGGAALGTGGVGFRELSGQASSHGRPQDSQYRTFSWQPLPTPRAAENVEVLWQTPFPAANGMQATSEGLWLVDGQTRGPHGERTSHVYLCSYDGEVLRGFRTGGETPSGMTHDGTDLWIAATYSREIIRANDHTGETISTHFTPGAGVIYDAPWDPSSRRSPLAPPPQEQRDTGPRARGFTPEDNVPGAYREGTGAHGMQARDGKLWVATPPSRMIYRIDVETWTVEHVVPAVHKRPHGIGFEGDYLWESDTDVSVFYKRDSETGEVLEAIRLGDDHPQPHGMSVWDGYLWWVDDIPGNSMVCRMPIPA